MQYRVYGQVVGTKYLGTFEADTPEEAIEQGLESDQAFVSLCHACAGAVDGLEVEGARAEPVKEEKAAG